MIHFHTRSYGKGYPLVILHGLLGSLDNWATLARRFAQHFHVFTFDARNHGRSSHSNVISYPTMATDVQTFMQRHSLASAHLLGHSMGGKTAMQLAMTHPALIDRLIVVDIAPGAYGRRHDHIFDALCGVDLKRYSSRKEVEEVLALEIPEYATLQFLLKNLGRGESGEFRWKMNLPVLKKHYDELGAAIPEATPFDRPALFIKGGKSSYITATDKPAIKKMFPRSSVVTIKNAGHWVHADAPDDLEKIVVKFLLG